MGGNSKISTHNVINWDLLLIKCENNRICGGYTSISWNSDLIYGARPKTFLFSIDFQQIFNPKNHQFNILNSPTIGPSFMSMGLGLVKEPMNGKDNSVC